MTTKQEITIDDDLFLCHITNSLTKLIGIQTQMSDNSLKLSESLLKNSENLYTLMIVVKDLKEKINELEAQLKNKKPY